MQKHSLDALAREQLEEAGRAKSSRAARTVVGGNERVMRQTLVALKAGAALDEHENPGEATLYVVRGRIELATESGRWEARTGDLIDIPAARHSVHAVEDSAFLLTAVPRGRTAPAG